MKSGFVMGAAMVAALATQPLAAQNSGVSADALFAAFEASGYELSDIGPNGNRIAQIPLEGEEPVNFNIRPVGCTDNQDCEAVIMFANFNLSAVTDEHKAAVSRFNDTTYYGRAYYLEDKVGIDSVVRIDSSGDIPYLRRRISDFRGIVIDFLSHMRGQ